MKNIREIAQLSGVSTATVSRYINGTGKVSDDTGNKIQQIVDLYGYVPNDNVKAIFSGRSMEVGLIVQNVTNPFFSELIDGVMKVAVLHGLSITVHNAQGDSTRESQFFEKLQKRRVSGIIVVNSCEPQIYLNSKIPMTTLDRRVENSNFVQVRFENSLKELLNTIEAPKYKNILFVKSESYNASSLVRELTVKNYFKNSHSTVETIAVDDLNKSVSDHVIKHIVDSDLIICWNDFVAHKIISAVLRRATNKLPNIIGYDNIKINEFFPYELTTIDQNIELLAEKLINSLLNTINTGETAIESIDAKIIYGNTTTKPSL